MARLSGVVLTLVLLLGLGVLTGPVAGAQASPTAPFAQPGDEAVVATTAVAACASPYGAVATALARSMGNTTAPTCTNAFPNGAAPRAGVTYYYPASRAASPRPVVIFVGGVASNPGFYDSSARLWASRGFAVVVPYDFFNNTAGLTVTGALTVARDSRDPGSPLFGQVDLSRTVAAGHSAGGQASLQAAALPPWLWRLVDPSFALVGAVATEPGPLAFGGAVTVPTLVLAGGRDTVVPAAWPRAQYDDIRRAPAWFAEAPDATHFSPIDVVGANPFSGVESGFLEYVTRGDPTAAALFTGPAWSLPDDPALTPVLRNGPAAA